MPELANPLSLFAEILKEQRSSKSPTVSLVQIRNVFPLRGSSSLVRPVTTPSLKDQSFGLPSHPARSLPLNRGLKPFSTAALASRLVLATKMAPVASANNNSFFIKRRSERFAQEFQSFDCDFVPGWFDAPPNRCGACNNFDVGGKGFDHHIAAIADLLQSFGDWLPID